MTDTTRITVYTTEPCRYCESAKTLLAQRNLDFDEINLAKDAQGRADLAARTGQMTFPQIMVANQLIGGFHDLMQADRSGALRRLASA